MTWSRSPARARRRSRRSREDFGISESCLHRWLKIADREDGHAAPAPTRRRLESAELRELRKRNKLLEQENEILRRATAYFARDVAPKMMYPLVLDLAADEDPRRGDLPGAGLLQAGLLQVAADPVSQRDWDDAHLINAALDIHPTTPSSATGSSPTSCADAGHQSPSRTGCARLCSQQRIWSVHAKKRGLNRKAGPPVHDDLVAARTSPPPARTGCG